MTPALLALAAAAAVDVDVSGEPGCVDAPALARALAATGERSEEASVRVRVQTAPDGLVVRVRLRSRDGQTARRRFDLRREDCPFVPALVARMYRRFVDELPVLEGLARVPPGVLAPAWPLRTRLWGAVSGDPGLGAAPRVGAQVGVAVGRALGLGWAGLLGYDLVPDQPFGAGRVRVHGLWLAAGPSLEGAVGRWVWSGELLALGGAILGVQGGSPEGSSTVLPLARVRLQARLRWPGRGTTGWRPHLGWSGEVALARTSLVGPSGANYREPWVRSSVLVGVELGTVR